MKIIVFTAYFHPHKGGVEKYVYEIYKRLINRGIEVSIVTCNTDKQSKEEYFDGLRIVRLDCWHILGGTFPIPKLNRSFVYTIKSLKKEGYDFVTTQTRFYVTTFVGFLFAKLNKIKLIHSESGSQHSILFNPFSKILSVIYDHTIGAIIVRWADINLVVSESAGKFVKHLGAKNFIVLYNGVDTTEFSRINTGIKNDLGISTGHIVVTYLGRLIEAKGVQDLISAFNKCEYPNDSDLVIIGHGNYSENLRKIASNNKNIHFLGNISNREVIEILSVTDIFVNPSYSEGMPTSVLEAGACRCCVIATDVGGTKEIIADSSIGLLFQSHDVEQLTEFLNKTIGQESLRSSMGINIMELIRRKFDWEIISKQFYNLLTK